MHLDEADDARDKPTAASSRRSLLAGALGAVLGSAAAMLGHPFPARAAAGDSLRVGSSNYAGNNATKLNATSSGGAFWVTQFGYGAGIRGDSVDGHGGLMTTAHADRFGLYAQQNGGLGAGAAILGDGNANIGVKGISDNRDGVHGASNGGPGVYGKSSVNYSVVGDGSSWPGVAGFSQTNHGIYGNSNSGAGATGFSQSGWGVYGYSAQSHAGHFSGVCYATAFTTSASVTVRLDHPLEPARRVLSHATVISDAAATLYSGTVRTDASGEATVELPGWFGAMNADVRYQLTPFADVRAWVKSKVEGNRFTIGTSEPNTEVSWLLTGVRADPYAAAHPLRVDSAKTGKERGRYLNPVEFGQPESAGVDAELRRVVAAQRPPSSAAR